MKKIIRVFSNELQNPQRQSIYYFFILFFSLAIHLLCMSQARLLVEEAYYWNYSQHLDWSYLDHPPMVALLIKFFTSVLGSYEFSVRLASPCCWLITSFFSYKLCELIQKKSGPYALLLLATLPFFFFQSIIITPDVPLISAWSACLYFLYRTLILNQARCWYYAGFWLGLGLLSKYTIILVAFSAFLFVLFQSSSRFWLRRKEPYLGLGIALLLFTPVLYWNAEHHWISFIFQSSRRFNSITTLSTHQLASTILLFITPLGVWGLFNLAQKNSVLYLEMNKQRFLQYFTFTPLLFFTLYSVNHGVNFNWTGPLFLALIPWLAALILTNALKKTLWFSMALCLLFIYSSVFLIISFNKSPSLQHKILIKVIAWDDLIQKINAVAEQQEQTQHKPVLFVPLDNYPINSELAFYQQLLLKKKKVNKIYEASGAHLFNRESLMYQYWSKNRDLSDVTLILLSKEAWRFDDPAVTHRLSSSSELKQVWSLGQGQQLKNIPYYYKVAQLK